VLTWDALDTNLIPTMTEDVRVPAGSQTGITSIIIDQHETREMSGRFRSGETEITRDGTQDKMIDTVADQGSVSGSGTVDPATALKGTATTQRKGGR
jgi:hypothetical protein